jgi:tetratricopeptide (TPR) repeat protein
MAAAASMSPSTTLPRSIAKDRSMPRPEEFYNRALAVAEERVGADHPQTATILHNMAMMYEAQRRYPDAIELLKRALAIREKALPEGHPDLSTTYKGLAVAYLATRQFKEAAEASALARHR